MPASSSASSTSSSESEASSSRSPTSAKQETQKLKRKFEDADSDSDSSVDEDEEKATVEDGNEAEVLSHAAQRRLKKKQKLSEKIAAGAGVSEESGTGRSKSGAKTKGKKDISDGKNEKVKRQNSVWVGNLSFKTTADGLNTFFADAGVVTRVHMPMKEDPRAANMKGPSRMVNKGWVGYRILANDVQANYVRIVQTASLMSISRLPKGR